MESTKNCDARLSSVLLVASLVCIDALTAPVARAELKSTSPDATSLPLMPGRHHLTFHTKVSDDAVDAQEWDLGTVASLGQMQDPFRTGNTKMKLVGIESRAVKPDRKHMVHWKLPDTIGLDGMENSYNPEPWLKEGQLAPKFHFQIKVKFMKEWLEKQDPDDFIIYIDADVIWGGCSEEQFLRDFDAITRASNSSLITGAEFGCAAIDEPKRGFACPINAKHTHEKIRKNYSYIPKPAWAKTLYGNDEKWVRGGHVDMNCTDYSAGPCGDPPEMIFLNSGFAAGKAKDMLELYTFQERKFQEKKVYGKFQNDMNTFNQYFYDSVAPLDEINHTPQARLTLDYGSRLVMNLHAMDFKVKELNEGALLPPFYGFEEDSLFEVLPNGDIKNKVTDQLTCFIHGNGNAHKGLVQMRKMQLSMKGIHDPYKYIYPDGVYTVDQWWKKHMANSTGPATN